MGPGIHPVHAGVIHPLALQGFPMAPHFNRRPLLLEVRVIACYSRSVSLLP